MHMIGHQVPFHNFNFLVLRQFTEYRAQALAQYAEYSLSSSASSGLIPRGIYNPTSYASGSGTLSFVNLLRLLVKTQRLTPTVV